jgi:hypothetical protein
MSNKPMSDEVVSGTHGGHEGGKFVGPMVPQHGERTGAER